MFGLGAKKIQERRYYPMIVSESGTEEKMSPEEDVVVWDAFEKLSEEKREVLLSSEMAQKIKLLQDKFGLSDVVTGICSWIIRKIFFEEFSLSVAEEKIRGAIASEGGEVEKGKDVMGFIQNEILTIKPKPKIEESSSEEPKQAPQTVKLPLLQALSKYEQLSNQLITEERIKLRSQPETVRPSLLYWIKYYRDELGVGHHSSVDRGNFLFRSENGKRLSPEERERVNLVLKSVEENYPVEVDTEQSTILFPAFVPPAPVRQPVPPMAPQRPFQPSTSAVFQPTVPASRPGEMSFSTKHVLPIEKDQHDQQNDQQAQSEMAPPRPVTPRSMAPGTMSVRSNPFHIRPVSMGKEQDK